MHFNPRPPCGGRLPVSLALGLIEEISTHAPRVGGDPRSEVALGRCTGISTHAPRVGGDSKNSQKFKLLL